MQLEKQQKHNFDFDFLAAQNNSEGTVVTEPLIISMQQRVGSRARRIQNSHIHSTHQSMISVRNIPRMQNCPDITILNCLFSLFFVVFLPFCHFVILPSFLFCLFVFLPFGLFSFLSFLSFCLFASLHFCLFAFLLFWLLVFLPFCLFAFLSFCLLTKK